MRITTLIENKPNKKNHNLAKEHGLSFLIEGEEYMIMSDVGQSGRFAENAAELGIDLVNVTGLVISHHHFDHGGGLDCFFKVNPHGMVYLRQTDGADYVADDGDDKKSLRYIGLNRDLLAEEPGRVVFVAGNHEIQPGVHLLADIPEVFPKPGGDRRLKMRRNGMLTADTFEHELVTVLEGEAGLVVLTGCAHNGVLNMVAAVQSALPDKPIQALIGGFHLLHEEADAVREIGENLISMGIQSVYTGHCTGDRAVGVLEDVLGESVHRLFSGLVMDF